MKFDIPKKKHGKTDEVFAHSVNLGADKTIRLARVKDILGGYSNQELLEILIDKVIEAYDDGEDPAIDVLPKKLRGYVEEETEFEEEEE